MLVNVNLTSPAFNGIINVKNLKTGAAKSYNSAKIFDQAMSAEVSAFTRSYFEKGAGNDYVVTPRVMSYLDTLFEATGDSFIKELPKTNEHKLMCNYDFERKKQYRIKFEDLFEVKHEM